MIGKQTWSGDEIALAHSLHDRARRAGTLPPARVIAVAASLSGGPTRTLWSRSGWRDYLKDARSMLKSSRPPERD
jgi:hypothetical protein